MAHRGSLTGASDRIAKAVLGQTIIETLARDPEHPRRERFVAASVVQRPYDMIALNFLERAEDDRSFRLDCIFADCGLGRRRRFR